MSGKLKRVYADIDSDVHHALKVRALAEEKPMKIFLEEIITASIGSKPSKRTVRKKATKKRGSKK